jgi:hypothetical protein
MKMVSVTSSGIIYAAMKYWLPIVLGLLALLGAAVLGFVLLLRYKPKHAAK